MAQIPLGNFGQVNVQQDVVQNRAITPDPGLQNRGAQQVASTLVNVGLNIIDERAKEDQALARVKASNAVIDRESQIKTIATDLDEQMRTGQLSYEKSEEAYNAAVAQLEPLQTPGLNEAEQGAIGNSLKRIQLGGLENVRAASAKGRILSAQSDLTSRMDMLGKDAAMPGANVEQINARMDAEDIDTAGRLAFGEGWTSKKQEFKDGNWSTHATQRVIESRESLASLQKVEHDLTAEDGFYAKKLDPEKRNQLLNTVSGRIFQVKEHQQQQAMMREMKAERVLGQMDKQAATGVPPPPALQQRWKSALDGTSAAGEFNTRMREMAEVQGLKRLPFAEQQQYVVKLRQQLASEGGTVEQVNTLNRLQTMIDGNIKLAKEDPLTFNALSTGVDVDPLDIAGITTAEGQQKLGEQIADRFDVVNSVRKAYGPEVARTPWKTEEQTMLKSLLEQADDGTKLQVLGAIGGAASSGSDYVGAIKPLIGDKPITMLAGMAQYRGWKGEGGVDVAQTLMQGQKLLSDKSVQVPKPELLAEAFEEAVGNAIPPGTPQRKQAFQGFNAAYVGLLNASGTRYEKDAKLDDSTVEKAISMVTGGVSDRAGAKVVMPYGMDEKLFSKFVDNILVGFAASTGISVDQLEDMPMIPVRGQEGSYFLLNGRTAQLDPNTGEPLVVKIK
ncbi:hypothetical protein VSQ82_14005 [Pseudomonas sp. MS-1(2024)]|uniref:hypothetical protein n=1 Tax=Pseudomonas sp. MS-1(2024) TaxID=3112251 RepID=UPI002DB5F30F|nr:hypothetical protein [Pseudomonas sp. MS-1(2024)]MEC4168343.1 hypothetical protein [Pseudomonas sp. MS-1(2024)]